MSDALDRLAARYPAATRPTGTCPRCGERKTEARLLVQVRRIDAAKPKASGQTVVNRMRSMCGPCVAEVMDQIVPLLPDLSAT